MTRPPRTLVAALATAIPVLVLALVVDLGPSVASPAGAAPAVPRPVVHLAGDGSGGDGTTTDDTPVPAQDIIPRPNSGRQPTEAGDRGGALQGLVFLAILAGVGSMVALGVRESRRSRRQVRPGQPSGP